MTPRFSGKKLQFTPLTLNEGTRFALLISTWILAAIAIMALILSFMGNGAGAAESAWIRHQAWSYAILILVAVVLFLQVRRPQASSRDTTARPPNEPRPQPGLAQAVGEKEGRA